MNRKTYPTDLQDAEWEILKPLLPNAKPGGRPRSIDVREVLNAIFYRERTGCAWDMLPHDLPAAKTVYDYFNKWSQDGTRERINGVLVRRVRQAEGRDPEPSAAIIDSQSVKTTEKGANGAMISMIRIRPVHNSERYLYRLRQCGHLSRQRQSQYGRRFRLPRSNRPPRSPFDGNDHLEPVCERSGES